MFSAVLNKLSKELSDIKSNVSWQDTLRATVYASIGETPIAISADSLEAIQELAPNKVAWQLFDHCAAVSRIYGLFEQAVGDLVSEYAAFLPKVTPEYLNLHEDTRVQYRLGVAQILSKWKPSKSMYSHLPEDIIAAGLADGLRKNPYSLLTDAFLIDTDNYRTDTINRIFKRFGFEDAFAWVRGAPSIETFCTNLGSDSADSYLNEFVRVRNDAAHGNVASISSAKEILAFAEFVDLVVKELASLLLTRILKDGLAAGYSKVLGTVLHAYSNNVVGVSSSSSLTIKIGDILYAGAKRLEPVSVVSLCKKEVDYPEIQLTHSLEFGVKLDKRVSSGASLYCWSE